MLKVLFICRGNVARSQMAEVLLKKEAKEMRKSFEVLSAGTKLSGPEQPIGQLTPALNEVLKVLDEVGIDARQNFRRNVTPSMADWADKIVLVVDERDPIPDYLQNNPKVETWDVLDPKGQDLEFTRKVRNQVHELVQDFITKN